MSNSNIEITIEDIIKAKNNDESSIMLIFNKYSLLINKYSTSYHLKNYDSEDLKQLLRKLLVLNLHYHNF